MGFTVPRRRRAVTGRSLAPHRDARHRSQRTRPGCHPEGGAREPPTEAEESLDMHRPPGFAARVAAALALAAAAPVAGAAGAAPWLLDDPLRLAARPALAVDGATAARILLAQQDDQGGGKKDEGERGEHEGGGEKEGDRKPAAEGSVDFDLLGEPVAQPGAPDPKQLQLRRKMLGWHQASGLALIGLQLSTVVVGQLNYQDKFAGPTPANTEKYRQPHAVLAYSTLAAFVATGTLALLAPSPVKKERRLDRVMVHRIAMFTAAAGLAAQAGLGIYTASREGYQDQEQKAQLHLAIGYVTLAAVTTGVAALIL
jgi:hypothetical protein